MTLWWNQLSTNTLGHMATGLGTSQWFGHLHREMGIDHKTCFSFVFFSLAPMLFGSMDISLGQLSLQQSTSIAQAKTSLEALWHTSQQTTCFSYMTQEQQQQLTIIIIIVC